MKFTKEQIKINKIETLYQGFMRLQRYHFDHACFTSDDNLGVQRELLIRQPAVGVLLFDPVLDEFVLIEQVRIGALEDPQSPWLLEVVAGLVEEGESEPDVACRESLEEAGCNIQRIIPIQPYWVSPGGSNEKVSLYLGLVDATKTLDIGGLDTEQEDIKVHRVAVKKAREMLENGEINNAMTLICLQWFFLNQQSLVLD